MSLIATPLLALLLAGDPAGDTGKYFKITIVDEQTGRGVPLVELRTVNSVRYFSDSNGIVAFYEPGLMNRTVFFHIQSHGYEFPKDGFGYRGKAIQVSEGGSVRLNIKRINIAERLYRVTGAGIYRDSILVGHRAAIGRPVLNALVLGSDSVVNAVYQGKLYWFWGDTNRPEYPLGNFHVPGAISRLPSDGGLDPEIGVDLEYFLDQKGFAKETARMPGDGPTWISGLVTLRDGSGQERLFASYVKVRKFLEVYQRGLVEFNPTARQFEKVAQFAMDAPVYPNGHPFKHVVRGVEYVYFADPVPLVRVRADPEHLRHLASYEAFTCLKEGSRGSQLQLDRAANGRLRYRWRKNTPPIGPQEQARLIKTGRLRPEEAWLHLQDSETGKPVVAHRGSVYWNDSRRRWVMIAVEVGGTSHLGEVWYAEADTPEGPWVYARKIVTHEKYTFYNPKQHPMFAKHGGKIIYFEGTYSHTFSGNPEQTPRYDYNQIMYKLDLSDSRLVLPVPIYRLSGGDAAKRFGTVNDLGRSREPRPVAFFALERRKEGTVPIFQRRSDEGHRALQAGLPPGLSVDHRPSPLFYALPAESTEASAVTVPLYEYVHEDGKRRAYFPGGSRRVPNYRRAARPICRVWRNPITAVSLPPATKGQNKTTPPFFQGENP